MVVIFQPICMMLVAERAQLAQRWTQFMGSWRSLATLWSQGISSRYISLPTAPSMACRTVPCLMTLATSKTALR